MNRILLLLALIVSVNLYAQTTTWQWIKGGNSGVSTQGAGGFWNP